jgi:aryl-alcohol dehydrogenase-like predicted oxidoreductase
MRTARLGHRGPVVSRICLGTWAFGGNWGPLEPRAVERTIATARAAGVNFFDTAYSYGVGAAERILGKALRQELHRDRDAVVIATKVGLRIEGDRMRRDSSPAWLRDGLEGSLRRLGIDHVDVLYLHWPDPHTPFAESAEALRELVAEGKVRWVGASNFDADQLAELHAEIRVTAAQPAYHMLRRDAEDEVLPACRRGGIGVVAYSTLAHGLLAGSVTADRSFHRDDWRRTYPAFGGDSLERNLEVVCELNALARTLGTSLPVLAVGWALANEAVTVAAVGARGPDHLVGVVESAGLELSAERLAEIDMILERAVQIDESRPEGRRLAGVPASSGSVTVVSEGDQG